MKTPASGSTPMTKSYLTLAKEAIENNYTIWSINEMKDSLEHLMTISEDEPLDVVEDMYDAIQLLREHTKRKRIAHG